MKLLTLGLVLSALIPSGLALAELAPEQVAARRALIEEAQRARAEGDHQRALNQAELALGLQSSASLRRFVAEEQMTLGLPARALGNAEVCKREAAESGSADHGAACEAILNEARGMVGYVIIKLTALPDGVSVRIAGQRVPNALLGQRYVVSAGEVVIEAEAPGFKSVRLQKIVDRGGAIELPITLEANPAAPQKPPVQPPKELPPSEGEFELSPWVPIGGSVAALGVAVALGVGLSANSELSSYEEECTAPGSPASCATRQTELQSELDVRAAVVNVAIGVGAIGLVGGTIGIFLSGTSEAQKAALWRGQLLF